MAVMQPTTLVAGHKPGRMQSVGRIGDRVMSHCATCGAELALNEPCYPCQASIAELVAGMDDGETPCVPLEGPDGPIDGEMPPREELLAFAITEAQMDVRYAIGQLRRAVEVHAGIEQRKDCCQRALDALERVEERLGKPC